MFLLFFSFFFFSLFFSFFLFLPQSTADDRNRPPTIEIDRRRLILVVPPGSWRSAYWSTSGPIRTAWYGALPLAADKRRQAAKQPPPRSIRDAASSALALCVIACRRAATLFQCVSSRLETCVSWRARLVVVAWRL
ncbi:hypothetical protein GW17_00023037 [Ensete ventricosum]|nr:hypothetical protein GW17_00023037 [Ensete ventricosum]